MKANAAEVNLGGGFSFEKGERRSGWNADGSRDFLCAEEAQRLVGSIGLNSDRSGSETMMADRGAGALKAGVT